MSPPHNKEATLLDVFLSLARNTDTIEDPVLECGSESWTYGDLDSISSGIALQFHEQYGLHPTVAVISENHPYVLALILATWKLDGIFVPLDCHAPLSMIKKMLENVEATCAVIPDDSKELADLLQEMNKGAVEFPKASTMLSLTQQFLDLDPNISPALFAQPNPSSLAVYLHTSSASSVSNLKCVQLTHGSISTNSRLTGELFSKAWPSVDFNKPKVLGFSPWWHIMAISHDIGGCAFWLGGCIIMGVLPSGYLSNDYEDDGQAAPRGIFGKEVDEMDILDRLLETALRSHPDLFVGVPWVLEGFMERHQRLLELKMKHEAERVRAMLQNFKCFGVGGAALTENLLSWASEMEINMTSNIGMTELGGPLFHTKIDHSKKFNEGWPMEDCLVGGAELILMNDAGEQDLQEGELLVRSINVSQGYLKYDNSAFSRAADGTMTFKTGDIYALTDTGRYLWKGRRDDYIQMISSETLDPRPIEQALNLCSGVAHCCVVGNNFLKTPSGVVCVIIQPSSPKLSSKQVAEITRTLAAVNRTLIPPLRIAWSRVAILNAGMTIPYTKKGAVFRKKLEELFGDFLTGLLQKGSAKAEIFSKNSKNGVTNELTKPSHESLATPTLRASVEETSVAAYVLNEDEEKSQQNNSGVDHSREEKSSKQWNKQEVEELSLDAVATILELEVDVLRNDPDTSFAEMGMDSNMAVRIVNHLNSIFGLHLPLNACHNFVNIHMLSEAILIGLGVNKSQPRSAKHQFDPLQPKEEVVIVGQAVRLPGDINTPDLFWDALISKREDIMVPVPADRWDHSSFYRAPTSTSPPRICDITFDKSGFLEVAHFDNNFFGISTPEALYISPPTRLTLETVFDALEDACIPVSKLKGTNMGVFVGASLDEGYTELLYQEKGFDAYSRFYGTGVAASTICGRISYLLDIHGPSSVTDTACSSGLVVLDQAVKYIQSGDGESAIVTAVNTNLWPGSFGFLSAQKMASPNSRCASFTNEADGYVPSEASVSFILKTKSAAIRDGNNILAVIKSTDVMHGGRTQGLVAPSVSTQISLQQSLLSKAGLEPSQIHFLETHGTGTSLGDLIEIQGINEVFRDSHPEDPLILGAAKTCVGHTEVAAGLVGLLKAIGTFKHAAVPGLVHLRPDNLNPSIDCGIVPITIPIETTRLPPKQDHNLYHGLVLANGFAGTFAGVILEEPSSVDRVLHNNVGAAIEPASMLFVASAKSVHALEDYIKVYLGFCQTTPAADFEDICYTTCIGREHYRYRFACVASNMEELIYCLEERLRSFSHKQFTNVNANRVAFAFPGQGSQYQGMASELVELYPNFKDILVFNASIAAEQSGFPILSLLQDKQPSSHLSIDDSQVAQICIFVYQYSMSLWLKNLGVEPCAVLGHSLGEISAAVVAGAMSYEFALAFVIKRAELLRSDPIRPGGMAIISASKETVTQLIHQLGFNGRVVIAVYNDARSHVVSGDLSAVGVLLRAAKDKGLRAAKLNVDQGFHSPMIYTSLPALQKWLVENQPSFTSLDVPLYSTVYGSEIPPGSRLRTSHWVEHARDPVRLGDAIYALSDNKLIDVILDVGPQPFILAAVQSMAGSKPTVSLSSKPIGGQNRAFLTCVAALFENGVNLIYEKLFSKSRLQGNLTPLPTYPYQRQRHYPDAVPSRDVARISSRVSNAPRQNLGVNQAVQYDVGPALYDLLIDHQIEGLRVAPGASLVDFFATRAASRSVKAIVFHSPLVIESPNLEVRGEIDASGRFFLNGGTNTNQVCSGVLSATVPKFPPKAFEQGHPPEYRKSKADIYESFKNVHLGPSFRKIQNIESWPTHADVLITVDSTQYPVLDRIRKIDCCLHALGGLVHREVPQIQELEGSFLPTSLDDFTLHTDDLPESFICRYRLPFDVARNYHVASVSFDVFSLSGKPLISCRKYSVAWIPSGVAIQDNKTAPVLEQSIKPKFPQWLSQAWISRDSPPATSPNINRYDQLLYLSPHTRDTLLLPVLKLLNPAAESVSLIIPNNLPVGNLQNLDRTDSRAFSFDIEIDSTIQSLKSTRTLIVLDLTSVDAGPLSDNFLHLHRHVLHLMKLLANGKLDIANFLVVSEMSISAHVDHSSQIDVQTPTVGAMVQGMFRVFRREMGLDSQVWALDFPRINTLDEEAVRAIFSQEINARGSKLYDSHKTIVYRHSASGGLERLVPVLRDAVSSVDVEPRFTGPMVIVGMGSIGIALATAFISKGCPFIIFVGRRSAQESEISDVLAHLNLQNNGRVSYTQADVCDFESLRNSFVDMHVRYGNIEGIVHTAAVISDSTIQNVDIESFERVLRPKVIGALNLHLISQELCPSLKYFALLSSISVSLGNQGQVAYVAANSYMEVLASYRLANNLPATALQLGPWESKLTQNMDTSNSLVPVMPNEPGISLILSAMVKRDAVQIIANFDIDRLATVPAYSNDYLFREILPSTPMVTSQRQIISEEQVSEILERTLRTVLELKPSEHLEPGDSLIACGIDSISFAQIRGRVMKELEVEVPMMFLSDSFSVREMIDYVVKQSLAMD